MTFMRYSSSLKFVKNNMFNISRLKVLLLGFLFAYLLKFITLSMMIDIGRLYSLLVKSSYVFKVLKFIQTSNLTFHLKT